MLYCILTKLPMHRCVTHLITVCFKKVYRVMFTYYRCGLCLSAMLWNVRNVAVGCAGQQWHQRLLQHINAGGEEVVGSVWNNGL